MLNKDTFDSLRRQRGLSLERLARTAEVSVSYANQISRGMLPSSHVRERVALALGCEPAELWRTVTVP